MDRYGLVKYPEEEGGAWIEPLEDGGYVMYSDHVAAVNELNAEIDRLLRSQAGV